MGLFYLAVSKLTAVGKMIAMKKCGNAAKGVESSVRINLIRSCGCVVISMIICLFSGLKSMSGEGWIYSILSGFTNAMLLFVWMLCAERCSLCTVEIFCMIGGVVLPMLSAPMMFSGESIGLFEWCGALMLIPAAYCFYPKGCGKKGFSLSALPLLLLAGLSNAGCVVTQKLFASSECGTVADFNLITFLFSSLVLGIFFCFMIIRHKDAKSKQKSERTYSKQLIVYIFAAIVMLYSSQYFNTLASGLVRSGVFYPLSYAIAMPLTLIADIVVFKEKIRVPHIIGLMLIIGAVFLINYKV